MPGAQDRAAWERALEAQFCAPGFQRPLPPSIPATGRCRRAETIGAGRWRRHRSNGKFLGLSQARSLLLYGRHDKNGTPENAMDLKRRLDARLVMYEDAATLSFARRKRGA